MPLRRLYWATSSTVCDSLGMLVVKSKSRSQNSLASEPTSGTTVTPHRSCSDTHAKGRRISGVHTSRPQSWWTVFVGMHWLNSSEMATIIGVPLAMRSDCCCDLPACLQSCASALRVRLQGGRKSMEHARVWAGQDGQTSSLMLSIIVFAKCDPQFVMRVEAHSILCSSYA